LQRSLLGDYQDQCAFHNRPLDLTGWMPLFFWVDNFAQAAMPSL
jgi:hypothetical protein